MTFKDPEVRRAWHRNHRAEQRRMCRTRPLHRRLGIETHVHRQAILLDVIAGGRGSKAEYGFGYDAVNRVWSNNHLFRASVTLAGGSDA